MTLPLFSSTVFHLPTGDSAAKTKFAPTRPVRSTKKEIRLRCFAFCLILLLRFLAFFSNPTESQAASRRAATQAFHPAAFPGTRKKFAYHARRPSVLESKFVDKVPSPSPSFPRSGNPEVFEFPGFRVALAIPVVSPVE